MAVSPECFPARKRLPSAGAFVSPKLSNVKLLQSLMTLSNEISSLKPLQCLLKRNSASIMRKVKLLSILFEEILRCSVSFHSQSIVLCFEEMYIVLQRIKTLIEDCSNGSKMWLLMQNELVASTFHEINVDLATLLDIIPIKEMNLNKDVAEIVFLIRKQCSENKPFVDPKDEVLRREVLTMLHRIKKEIVPDHSKLAENFRELGLFSFRSCKEELECLEEEMQNQNDDKSKSEVVALIGLVRYAKCVLFGSSMPRIDSRRGLDEAEVNTPADFRCPISLELMRDPVVISTGQTYDRESITSWIIESGHNTCPKTGQTLVHTNLIPNRALKNLVAMWCRDQRIPFETAGNDAGSNGVMTNKAALEATKMTVSFLVKKLASSRSTDAANGVMYELRVLAKTDSDSRACIAEAGAIPLLVRYLSSDVGSDLPNLQVNAVTTILNLSILEANKTRIMETDGALNGVIEVLRSGATWEAKGNAAATIFSLSSVNLNRKRLGRKTRVVKGLIDLAKVGAAGAKKDALVAILNLAAGRDTVGRLVEGGVVEMVIQVFDEFPEETAALLEVVVKRGGLVAVAAAYGAIRKLGALLREGSDRARESAAAALVTICRHGGSEMVVELANMPGIERMIWELSGSGTARARRKAASLLRILRRWASALEENTRARNSNASTMITSTRAMLLS